MKFTKKMIPLAVAASLGLPAMMVATPAAADVSANIAVSNMYLWRGVNLAQDGGTVSGGLDYAHESGFYAGFWTSSESGGHETDLYLGFSGEASGFGYDVGYIEYMYPEEAPIGTDIGDSDASEFYLSGSYSFLSVGANFIVDNDWDDDAYYTISGEFGPVTATYGMWDLDDKAGANATPTFSGGDEYSHITLDYAATDELTFSVSVASADVTNAVEEDPLFAVTYAKSFDL